MPRKMMRIFSLTYVRLLWDFATEAQRRRELFHHKSTKITKGFSTAAQKQHQVSHAKFGIRSKTRGDTVCRPHVCRERRCAFFQLLTCVYLGNLPQRHRGTENCFITKGFATAAQKHHQVSHAKFGIRSKTRGDTVCRPHVCCERRCAFFQLPTYVYLCVLCALCS